MKTGESGCGRLALGFKNAAFRTVLAVEWDAHACDTLRANITDRVAQFAVEEIDTFPEADVVAGGERYYPGLLLEQVDEIARHPPNRAKTVEVSAFDYARVG